MDSEPSRRSGMGFALGVLVGVLLGLLSMSLVPIALVLLPLVLLASVKALREVPLDTLRSAEFAGVLVGAGAVFTLGALNTIGACASTEDFCGNANVAPFLVFALATLAAGVVASMLTVVRAKPTAPADGARRR